MPAGRSVCASHRRREALAPCATCGLSLCEECIVPTPVGLKCGRCVGTLPSRRARSRALSLVLVTAGVVLVAAAAIGLALRDREPRRTAAMAPVGARSQTVQLPSQRGVRLAGVLDLPAAGAAEGVPGALIIPGFGPTDRNGVATPGLPPDPLYRDLSDALVASGIATFRYDKRGTGQTVLGSDDALTLEDLVGDAGAALAYMADRKGVDPERLVLIGHDEGGLIALNLAAADRRVAAVVLVATPGRPLVEVLVDELSSYPTGGPELATTLQSLVAELLDKGVLKAPDQIPPELRSVLPAGQERYLRALFAFDPVAAARAVTAPVLIVRGEADSGISAIDTQRLAEAIGRRAEVMVGHKAGHTLAVATGTGATAGDDHEQEFHQGVGGGRRDTELLSRITAWVTERTGAATEVRIRSTRTRFNPDDIVLAPGLHRFILVNDDSDVHELRLSRSGRHDEHLAEVLDVSPGTSKSFAVQLDVGHYEIACHRPGHFEAGMHGIVRVEPARSREPT